MVFDFEISTFNSIKEFNEYLMEVKKKYPNLTMPMAREYLKSGTRIIGVPDELYDALDKLSQIRREAIEGEKVHILAQAQKAGVRVPDEIASGKSLIPFFEDAAYEKVPTLRVFEYMCFYTPDEIAQMTNKPKANDKQENTSEER